MEAAGFASAGSTNRVDLVYVGILEAISSGEFREHARLPTETQLAERYKVSRPTVREALSRLRVDGLVASRRGSGSYVLRRPDRNIKRFAPVESIADVERCFVFRVALESAAAALAAEVHEQRDLEEIRDAMLRLERHVGTEEGVEADLAFHRAIAKASHNHFFIAALSMIEEQIRSGIRLSRDVSLEKSRERIRIFPGEHRDIYRAIEERQTFQAAEAMRLHLGNARRTLFEDDRPDIDAVHDD